MKKAANCLRTWVFFTEIALKLGTNVASFKIWNQTFYTIFEIYVGFDNFLWLIKLCWLSYFLSIMIIFTFKLQLFSWLLLMLYLIIVFLHSPGSLDPHTTLNGKDDLELEVFIYAFFFYIKAACWLSLAYCSSLS